MLHPIPTLVRPTYRGGGATPIRVVAGSEGFLVELRAQKRLPALVAVQP